MSDDRTLQTSQFEHVDIGGVTLNGALHHRHRAVVQQLLGPKKYIPKVVEWVIVKVLGILSCGFLTVFLLFNMFVHLCVFQGTTLGIESDRSRRFQLTC